MEPKPGAGTNVIISNDLNIHFPTIFSTFFGLFLERKLIVELLVFISIVSSDIPQKFLFRYFPFIHSDSAY